jgi:hypothetical protein
MRAVQARRDPGGGVWIKPVLTQERSGGDELLQVFGLRGSAGNWSFVLDLSILWRTLRAVLSRSGAY